MSEKKDRSYDVTSRTCWGPRVLLAPLLLLPLRPLCGPASPLSPMMRGRKHLGEHPVLFESQRPPLALLLRVVLLFPFLKTAVVVVVAPTEEEKEGWKETTPKTPAWTRRKERRKGRVEGDQGFSFSPYRRKLPLLSTGHWPTDGACLDGTKQVKQTSRTFLPPNEDSFG